MVETTVELLHDRILHTRTLIASAQWTRNHHLYQRLVPLYALHVQHPLTCQLIRLAKKWLGMISIPLVQVSTEPRPSRVQGSFTANIRPQQRYLAFQVTTSLYATRGHSCVLHRGPRPKMTFSTTHPMALPLLVTAVQTDHTWNVRSLQLRRMAVPHLATPATLI